MGWWRDMKDRAVGRAYRRHRRALENLAPARLRREADAMLLAAFRRAARGVPAYGRVLAAAGVALQAVTTVEQFRERVPVLDKRSVFEGQRLRDLCVGGTLGDVGLVYTSSGHSGVFSFGIERRGTERQAALGVEFLFDTWFDIRRRRTVLVNCLPMDVRIPTRTLALAEAGVRSDAVVSLIRKLAGEFEQFVLVGESLFLKQVVDEGADAGIRWEDLRVNVVTGGEFIPETYRSYLADALKLRADSANCGRIFLNMGLSELSISIFHEEPETVEIRRAAMADARFGEALAGGPTSVCPEVMQYDPRHAYVECLAGEAGPPELIISTLDPDREVPLLRYRTGDRGRTLDHSVLVDLLGQFGYERLAPRQRLPVAVLWGRDREVRLVSGQAVSVSEVKEALYEDAATARQLTGRFHISPLKQAACLEFQVRPSASTSEAAVRRLAEAVRRRTSCPVDVRLLEHNDFPYDRTYEYQRKPQYISQATASVGASPRETVS